MRLAAAVQGRNLAGWNLVHERPEIGGFLGESAFALKHPAYFGLGKRLPQPVYGCLVTQLQHPEDRIVGIGLRRESVKNSAATPLGFACF